MQTRSDSNRRTFLRAASSSVLVAGALTKTGSGAANDRLTVGLVGCGGRGMHDVQLFKNNPNVEIAYVCDADASRLASAAKALNIPAARAVGDMRKLLDDKSLDIVLVTTPDHWHSPASILACEAGKHVYVEKPISHTVDEGKAMVKAAREGDREVVVGLHRRVSPHCISGMEFLKSGKVGKIGMVRLFAHAAGGPGEKTPDSEPPPGMDWDLWLGPAPKRAFNKAIHPKGFRHFLDYANGTLGDWGVHWFDQLF